MSKRGISKWLVLLMVVMQFAGGMGFAAESTPSNSSQEGVLTVSNSDPALDTPSPETTTGTESAVTVPADESAGSQTEPVTKSPLDAGTPTADPEPVKAEAITPQVSLDTSKVVTEEEMKAAGIDAVNQFFLVKYVDGTREIRRIDSAKSMAIQALGKNPPEIRTLISEYDQKTSVDFAEPITIYTASDVQSTYIPNDPYLLDGDPGLWGIGATHTNVVYGRIPAVQLKNVVVAVVDTGVDYTHPDLKNVVLTSNGKDYVNNDTDPMDDCGHGTHVSGTIAAEGNNGVGIVGIADGVRILPVKVLNDAGKGYSSNVALGIRWAADHGANVINMSLGSPDPSKDIEEAITYANSKGVTIVAASGNDAKNNSGQRAPVSYPAAYDHVIAVGAVRHASDGKNWVSDFSDSGKELDVVAPGENVLSSTRGASYAALSGTSMATPHVAALAALLVAQDSTRTPDQIESIIKSTAQSDFSYDSTYGSNKEVYGAGLIDCAKALGLNSGSQETRLKSLNAIGFDLKFNSDTKYYVLNTLADQLVLSPTGYSDTQSAWVRIDNSTFKTMKMGSDNTIGILPGVSHITVRSFSEDNLHYTDYSIEVRNKFSGNGLMTLMINRGILSPAFSADLLSPAFQTDTTTYSASVPYNISRIDMIASAAYADATLTLNGHAIESNSTQGLDLTTGLNTFVIGVKDALNNLREYTLSITSEVSPWNDKDLPVNKFRAEYYDTRSPENPVDTAIVDQARINYSWSDFHQIPSPNFKGIWAGEFQFGKDTTKTMCIGQSRGKTTVLVDGNTVAELTDQSKEIAYSFKKGNHVIRVIYENNWHTTEFAFALVDPNRVKSNAEISQRLGALLDKDTLIYHGSLYECSSIDTEAQVNLAPTDKSVVLFLTSYDPVNWKIVNPGGVKIKAVVIGSYLPGSDVSDTGFAEIMETKNLYYSSDFKYGNLFDFTDKEVAGYTFKYSATQIALPETLVPEIPTNRFKVTIYRKDVPGVVQSVSEDSSAGVRYSGLGYNQKVPADKFLGVWAGKFEFVNDEHRFIEYYKGQGKLQVKVDGNILSGVENTSGSIPFIFRAGTHTVEISYESASNSADFNVGLIKADEYMDKDQAALLLKQLLTSDTKLFFVRGNDQIRNFMIHGYNSQMPVVVVLSSKSPIVWEKSLFPMAIKAVIVDSEYPGSYIDGFDNPRVIRIRGLKGANTFRADLLKQFTDRNFDGYSIAGDRTEVGVPEIAVRTMTPIIPGGTAQLDMPVGMGRYDDLCYDIDSRVSDATLKLGTPSDSSVWVVPALSIALKDQSTNETVALVNTQLITQVTASSGANWDGTLALPRIKTATKIPLDGGTAERILEIGMPNLELQFAKPVRILFPGMAGKKVKWSRDGVHAQEITKTLSEDDPDAVEKELVGGVNEGKMDIGNDLVIWTRHFTEFVAYTAGAAPKETNPVSNTGSSTSSGGGGGAGGGGYFSISHTTDTNIEMSSIAAMVPANSISGDTMLKTGIVDMKPNYLNQGQTLLSDIWDIERIDDSKSDFLAPWTLKMNFSPSKVDSGSGKVGIWWFDEHSNVWSELSDSSVNLSLGTVSVKTVKQGRFALVVTDSKSLATTIPLEPVALATPIMELKDVKGHWAAASIAKLLAKKAISGNPDGTFQPEKHVTRAEFITMLVKGLELKGTTDKTFSDLNGHWAADAIRTAVANGVLNGFEDGTIRPDALITREQMAVMVAKAAKLAKAVPDKHPTDESTISSWAKDAVLSAIKNGIISGYGDGSFRPSAFATKAEAVTIIAKCIK